MGTANLFQRADLIKQLTKREVSMRYKGSYLGVFWSFITPILMLLVYTFVFGVVFKSRWPGQSDSQVEYALLLFAGITIYNVFSELISKSPYLIISNANYVKKVVFPLHILPVVTLFSSLIHALISFCILLVGVLAFFHTIPWTVILVPIVSLPIILLSLGLSWLLSSLGVFLRDIGHLISIFLQVLMFLSPIFYSVESLPQNLRIIFYINPITYTVEDMRRVIIWGEMPNWGWIGIGTVIGLIVSYLGYYWFSKTREGFADVL